MENWKSKYCEYIMGRKIEEYTDLEGDYIIIKEFPILLQQSFSTEVKRIQVNAAVSKLSLRVNDEGKEYVEYQGIWLVEGGYKKLPQYIIYKKEELQNEIKYINTLNE